MNSESESSKIAVIGLKIKKTKGGELQTDLFQFLDKNDIGYERCDHPAVYTVEEANRRVPDLPARKTKNLFLRNGRGTRHFLVIVGAEKMVDLKRLKDRLGAKRLGFGSPERLKKYLGLNPGSVSLLGIFNNEKRDVEVVIDSEFWQASAFQFHPLVNTSTLVMQKKDIKRFLDLMGHQIHVIQVPGK